MKRLLVVSIAFFSCLFTTALATPIAYWSFNEGSGNTAKDSIGTNNGIITNATWVDGKDGKALSFDGSGDYVNIQNPFSGIQNQFTFECWIKINAWPANIAGNVGTIYRHRADNNDFNLYFNVYNSVSKCLYIALTEYEGTVYEHGFQSKKIFELGIWYHIMFSYDGSTKKLFVNDTLDTAIADVFNRDWSRGYRRTDIGDNPFDTNHEFCFNGVIDEFKIYNYAKAPDTLVLPGPAYQFNSVELNNVNVSFLDTPLVEKGRPLNIIAEIHGIKDVYDVRFKAWIDGYVDEIRAVSSLFDIQAESTYYKTLTLDLPSDMAAPEYYTLHLELSDKDNSNELDYVLLVEEIQHLLTIVDVMTSATELKPGDYFYTTVRVKNIGAQLERDIKFIVSVSAWGISQRTYIDELDTGYATNSGAMLLMIPLTAQPDTYASNVNVIYNGGKDTLDTSFSIIVSPSVGIASLKLPEQHIPSSGIMSDEWYDLSGRAVTKSNQLKPGLYIIKTKQHCSKVLIVR